MGNSAARISPENELASSSNPVFPARTRRTSPDMLFRSQRTFFASGPAIEMPPLVVCAETRSDWMSSSLSPPLTEPASIRRADTRRSVTSPLTLDVTLRRVSARRIDAGSVSGGLRLEDIQSERVSAHTTSGGISMAGPLAKNVRCDLKSMSGDVRLVLAGNTGFELDASSFSGEIRAAEFPITLHGGTSRHSIRGTYGDGSAVLNLSTFSG